jgi:iron(III) transport system substrate-binding protein
VVPGVRVANPVLAALGEFRYDTLNVAALGRNQSASQKIYDRVAWK